MAYELKSHTLRQWNRVVRLWEVPCSPTLEIWLETLFPALGLALLELVTPGKMEGTVKMLMGRYHGLGGKAINRAVRGAEIPLVEMSNGNRAWHFLGPIDRALFWWMIVDLVADGLWAWETMAYERAGCFDQQFARAHETGFSPLAHTGDWQVFTLPFTEGNVDLYAVDGWLVPVNFSGGVGLSFHAKSLTGEPAVAVARLQDVTSNVTIFETEEITVDDIRKRQAIKWNQKLQNRTIFTHRLQWQAKVSGAAVDITGTSSSIGGRFTPF